MTSLQCQTVAVTHAGEDSSNLASSARTCQEGESRSGCDQQTLHTSVSTWQRDGPEKNPSELQNPEVL